MQRRTFALIIMLVILVYTFTISAAPSQDNFFTETDDHQNLRLKNDYVVIVVNQDENGQGRFAIETTGGAPFRDNDDQKPLVYGRPKPWTSYTSVWLDGKYYVFGGKTERRAGRNGDYGRIILPPTVEDNSIRTVTAINDIELEQILTIVKSSTTGLYDSVQIKYRVENKSEREHKIGLRVLLDTMLGQNDGAPFRIGQDAVTNDKLYFKDQLPTFWQAFDSISTPQVTSQGTFTGPGVTAPDKVYLADWGSFADGTWEFDFNPGEEFIRKGEYETDSAIALYWVPLILAPGEVRTYVTNYGLGGITIVPGLISLGVTSPAEVTLTKKENTFPVIAYIENTSEIKAKDVKIHLDLPTSFTANQVVRELGDMEPGDIAQIVWDVEPAGNNLPARINYQVRVEASNTDANQVTREVKFVGPPELKASIKLKDKLKLDLGKIVPNPFTVQVNVKNDGGSILYDGSANLLLPPGLVMAPKEIPKKYFGYLDPGEELAINWEIRALQVAGSLPFAVEVKGLDGYSTTKIETIDLPRLDPLLYLSVQGQNKKVGDYISVLVTGENIFNLDRLDFVLKYDPKYLQPVYVSRGNIFVRDGKLLSWSEPLISSNGYIKFSEELPDNVYSGTMASIHFKVVKTGAIPITIENLKPLDVSGQEIELEVINLK